MTAINNNNIFLNKLNKFSVNDLIVDPIPLSENFNCPICEEWIMDFNKSESMQVLQCREGHTACRTCWIKSLENKKECMICRTKVCSVESLSKNIYLQREFRNQSIYCPNLYKDLISGRLEVDEENGCKEIIKIDQLEGHLKQCQFQFIECPNDENCKSTFRKNKIEEHSEKCNKEKIQCKHCNQPGIVINEIDQHYKDHCEMYPIECTQSTECKSSPQQQQHHHQHINKSNLKQHIQKDCQFTIIKCKYYEGGCEIEFPRHEQDQHMLSIDHSKYMELTIEKHIEKLSKVEYDYKKLEKDYQNLSHDFNLLSSQLSVIREIKFKYQNKWVIQNWSQKLLLYSKPKSMESPEFNVGNLKFKVQFYPNGGLSEESKDFLSIYLVKSEESISSKVLFSFELINKDPIKNRKLSSTNIFNHESKWGWRSFINNNLVNVSNGYIISDSITFNINVEILPEDKDCFIS